MRVSGEFVFINTVRLRLDLDNYASFSHLLSVFRAVGIGSLQLHHAPSAKEWQRFLALLSSPSTEPPAAQLAQLSGKLTQQGLTVFEIGHPMAQPPEEHEPENGKETAQQH